MSGLVQLVYTSDLSGESSEKIAAMYEPRMLEALTDQPPVLMRISMAMYDEKDFEEALRTIEPAQALAEQIGPDAVAGMRLWKGMLHDLLGEREQARALYEEVAGMDVSGPVSLPQYGLARPIDALAEELLAEPFTYIENQM